MLDFILFICFLIVTMPDAKVLEGIKKHGTIHGNLATVHGNLRGVQSHVLIYFLFCLRIGFTCLLRVQDHPLLKRVVAFTKGLFRFVIKLNCFLILFYFFKKIPYQYVTII
jgi:hypothetical protein